MKRVIVPIDLGESPTRCALVPAARPPATPELVQALIDSYRRQPRAQGPDVGLEVGFFRGGLPSPAQLEAARPWPVRVACSPADLQKADAERLRAEGVATIELEVATFSKAGLRACHRGYTARQAVGAALGLHALGFRVGLTLMPGLPGTGPDDALADARRIVRAPAEVAPRGPDTSAVPAHFVRLNPALAFEGSGLAERVAAGMWRPQTVPEAVATLVEMVDVLAAADVPVARIGLQPKQDLPVAVVAGPLHPDLRGRVEVHRFRQRMAEVLRDVPRGQRVTLGIHPKDLTWAKGTANENLRALRARHGLSALRLWTDEGLPRGTVVIASVA